MIQRQTRVSHPPDSRNNREQDFSIKSCRILLNFLAKTFSWDNSSFQKDTFRSLFSLCLNCMTYLFLNQVPSSVPSVRKTKIAFTRKEIFNFRLAVFHIKNKILPWPPSSVNMYWSQLYKKLSTRSVEIHR